MATLFGILQVGSKGVIAAQAGLDTTGHNIANANTEGYSRQRIIQRGSNPLVTPYGTFGQGVDIQGVERIRDEFIDRQVRNANSDAAFYQQQEVVFGEIAAIMNDPLSPISESSSQSDTGGLNNLLARFYASWNELSLNPEAPEARSATIESGVTLAETFGQIDSDLIALRQDLDTRVAMRVEEVNTVADALARLNERVAVAEVGENTSANDLRDERDRLLERLSSIVPIESSIDSSGLVSVQILGNRLVDNSVVNHLVTRPGFADGEEIKNVFFERQGITALDAQLDGGELGGLIDSRNRIITDLLGYLDSLARSVISEVNRIHTAAVGLDGYGEITTAIDLPSGASDVDSTLPLNTIFNNPRLSNNPTAADYPYTIQDGSFTMRLATEDGATRESFDVAVRTTDTMEVLRERIDRADGIVSEVLSGASFNPVFAQDVTSVSDMARTDIVQAAVAPAALPALSTLFPTEPIGAGTGTFTIDFVVKDKLGALVDANTLTPAADPFQVTIDLTANPAYNMQNFVDDISTTTGGRVIAQIVDGQPTTDRAQVRFTAGRPDETFSIQQDSTGIIKALQVPVTDPTLPLLGGISGYETVTFPAGTENTDFLGAGNPNFSTVFPGLGTSGNGPSVIGEGDFELVTVDILGNTSVRTITLADGVTETLAQVAAAIDADPDVTATIDGVTGKLTIDGTLSTQYYFQNDETGLVEALGLDALSGHGTFSGQDFNTGEFEVVVANDQGKVTDIFEVQITAALSSGVASLADVVDAFNQAAAATGAPVSAAIVEDPRDPSVNRIRFLATGEHEFTFRSDDSRVLSALGLHRGPALDEEFQAPIENSAQVYSIGDNIGPSVRAEFDSKGQIKITATGTDEVTFTDDSSHFLASANINTFFSGTDAGTMGVTEQIIENRRYLAASKTGSAGDNQAATALSQLQFDTVIEAGSHSDFYRSVISGIGLEGSRVSQFLDTTNQILMEFNSLQEQQSGVSLDEESINLIQYQQAFVASARVISTIDELIDIVVNVIGA